MKTYVSMLRGVNVGDRRKIRMADLRELYEFLGLHGGKTYLQSGNVVFRSEGRPPSGLSADIEAAIEASYGLDVRVFLRDVP